MPTPEPLSIKLSAREVVARGYPFAPFEDEFSDADVALDWISSLAPPTEPVVLRAESRGGDDQERLLVRGDWLCDTRGAGPRALPPAMWWFDEHARSWAKGKSLLDAWEGCDNPRWLLLCAASLRARAAAVRVMVECAEEALASSRVRGKGGLLARDALAEAGRWAGGGGRGGGDRRLRLLSDAAFRSIGLMPIGSAQRAAAYSAYIASSAAFVLDRPLEDVVSSFLTSVGRAGQPFSMSEERVRSLIPTIDVLRAAAGP